ncbi:MAG TPA: hypothetical protein VIK88_03395 [Candidatus Bathyarchaeia archaeon]
MKAKGQKRREKKLGRLRDEEPILANELEEENAILGNPIEGTLL